METSDILYFLPPALLGVIAIAFLLLWRIGIVDTWHWSAAFAQAGLGFVISTFPIEPKFDAFVSGMIFMGAACCYSIAIRLHFRVPNSKFWHRTFVTGYTLLLCQFVFVMESLKHQLFLTDFAFACVLGAAVFAVASKAHRAADIALVVTAALIVVDTLARTFLFTFFFESSDQLADFADSTYNLAVHITTITIGLSFPFAALGAMASKAIDRHRDTSERDPLTGLLNRRGFEKQAVRMYRADSEGAVVICDLDHFKEIMIASGTLRAIASLSNWARRSKASWVATDAQHGSAAKNSSFIFQQARLSTRLHLLKRSEHASAGWTGNRKGSADRLPPASASRR